MLIADQQNEMYFCLFGLAIMQLSTLVQLHAIWYDNKAVSAHPQTNLHKHINMIILLTL